MFQMFDRVDRSVPINLLGDLLSKVSDIGKLMGTDKKMSDLPLMQLCEDLLRKDGEATGLAQASYILDRYQVLSKEEKLEAFINILNQFGTNKEALETAINLWLDDKSESNARNLHFMAEPRSQSLVRRLNQAPNATLALVNMRTDLLGFIRKEPSLKSLDQDFSHLFKSWFNKGFLQLQRINWETPASVLEKIIAYEAVHEISSWDDLRLRVAAPDRRLYGYFHPALGMEPLIFVEVALTDVTSDAIAPILSDDREHLDPDKATTAVFYSISNCQSGLKGISFGNFLIKQVVESLHREFPNVKTFVTLSPIPGFRRWALSQQDSPDPVTNGEDLIFIEQLEYSKEKGTLKNLLREKTEDLRKLAAKYLVSTRSPRGGASDAVSRFHLGNGAQLENIHASADNSENGLNNSWGCMVNYQYRIKDIERNHEAYVNGDEIMTSSSVQSLLK